MFVMTLSTDDSDEVFKLLGIRGRYYVTNRMFWRLYFSKNDGFFQDRPECNYRIQCKPNLSQYQTSLVK